MSHTARFINVDLLIAGDAAPRIATALGESVLILGRWQDDAPRYNLELVHEPKPRTPDSFITAWVALLSSLPADAQSAYRTLDRRVLSVGCEVEPGKPHGAVTLSPETVRLMEEWRCEVEVVVYAAGTLGK